MFANTQIHRRSWCRKRNARGPCCGRVQLCAHSLGDLLRKERGESGSLFGDFIDESMKNSIIVPALLSMLLLKGSIEAALAEGKAGVLLDGFPRSVQQATAFEEEVSIICDGGLSSARCQADFVYLSRFLTDTRPSSWIVQRRTW